MTKRTKHTSLDDLARMMAEGFAETALKTETATKQDIANMATKDDIADMATKSDVVRLESRINGVGTRLDDTNRRLGSVETKLDRALYREISRHDHLIHQLANKTNVKLEY